MSDESDAEFERRYPQKQSGIPAWAILLIVLGSVGFVGCIGMIGLGVVGFLVAPAPPPPIPPPVVQMGEPPQVKEFFTRAEFELAVTGKTVAEVKATLGEPPMSAGDNGEETWVYRQRTKNPATGLTDDRTDVEFRGGKAVRVSYHTDAPPGGPGPQPGGPPPSPGK